MIIEYLLYIGFAVSLIILFAFSLIVKDIAFVRDHPFDFFLELLFISVIPALLMVFVFGKTRKVNDNELLMWFLTLMIKLMIFHILFQFSGLYSIAFPNTRG